MARPERFELPTARFVAEYSIQLSYGRTGEANYPTGVGKCQHTKEEKFGVPCSGPLRRRGGQLESPAQRSLTGLPSQSTSPDGPAIRAIPGPDSLDRASRPIVPGLAPDSAFRGNSNCPPQHLSYLGTYAKDMRVLILQRCFKHTSDQQDKLASGWGYFFF
jgi:hypothetical protein